MVFMMASAEQTILTNMCMVRDGDRVLVQKRSDPNWPGFVFPGGHVEPGEAFRDAVIREVFEETGITIAGPRLCGLKQFWTKEGYRYIVFLYRTETFSGTLCSSDEGEALWMTLDELAEAPKPRGFCDMIPVFLSDTTEELFYTPEDGLRVLL